MHCITVAVGFADILRRSLPWNRQHFDAVLLVTSTAAADDEVVSIAADYSCDVLRTNVFYANGAAFNKFAALEEAVSQLTLRDWVCFLDVDILLPDDTSQQVAKLQPGCIYNPPRRMLLDAFGEIPPQSRWCELPLGPPAVTGNIMAGYMQIFHAGDAVLQQRPWYDLDLSNASDGDTRFARRWAKRDRRRPGFEVCHLGPDSVNWCGRVIPYADGSKPPQADIRMTQVREFLAARAAGQTKR